VEAEECTPAARKSDHNTELRLGTLRLCAPRTNTSKWRRCFGLLFQGVRAVAGETPQRDRQGISTPQLAPYRLLLLGPAHLPLREIGAALASQTQDSIDIHVHIASSLPLPPDSKLPQEDLRYVVFVVDMTDRYSFTVFRETSTLVLAATLQLCGLVLVYGADDESSHTFALADLLETAQQRCVQILYIPAPNSIVGLEMAARAGAERLGALLKGDISCPGQTLLRIRALQASACESSSSSAQVPSV
jgi:hypothetical protein